MKEELVSILMPNYNCWRFISKAIKSVLGQTHENFELIIVDDYSTDKSWELISDFVKKDKRIKAFRNKKNLGRPKTRNYLLSLISKDSKYFLWLDADDVLDKNLIHIKADYICAHPDIFLLGNAIVYVDEGLNFIKERYFPETFNKIKKKFIYHNPFSQGGLMLKTSLKTEKYNPKYLVCQDYELWCRLIAKNYVGENLDKALYYYRQQKEQAKQKNLKLSLWNTIKIKSKYLFKLKYFSLVAFARYILEIIMLLVPKKLLLWCFYKTKHNKRR